MLKKSLPILLLPLLIGGCASQLTNLTPLQQPRSTNNLYRLEVKLSSRQQTLRWDSIRPHVIVGTDSYDMTPTPLMTNRWEGLIPVSPGVNSVRYHYLVDFQTTAFGPPKRDSASSREYTLRILDQ